MNSIRFSVWQAKAPAPTRSFDPGLPPLKLLIAPHPILPQNNLHQRFHYGTVIECPALGFGFAKPNSPPPVELSIPASHHLNNRLPLITYAPTAATANDFTTGPILSAGCSVVGLEAKTVSLAQYRVTYLSLPESPHPFHCGGHGHPPRWSFSTVLALITCGVLAIPSISICRGLFRAASTSDARSSISYVFCVIRNKYHYDILAHCLNTIQLDQNTALNLI